MVVPNSQTTATTNNKSAFPGNHLLVMKRYKILFVAARPPYPLDTGAKIRSHHILAGLCKEHDVDVLTYWDETLDERWSVGAGEIGVKRLVQVDNVRLNQRLSVIGFAWSILRGLPATVGKYQTKGLRRAFCRMLNNDYDLVHIEHVHLSWLLRHVDRTRVACSLDAHNVETQIAIRMRDMARSPVKKIALALHAGNMRRFEKKAFAYSDMIMAVSEEDAGLIREMSAVGLTVALVENGVDIDYFSRKKSAGNGNFTPTPPQPTLVFVGSMDWQPNIDGVLWFAEKILPLVRRGASCCRFVVVGRNPTQAILDLAVPGNGVYVTGTVEDVRPYLTEAAIVVVPLRYGGGTRLKILEAFAMELPVVSTTLGCEGIVYRDGRHLLVADDPEEFARKCCHLLDDADGAAKIAGQARLLALEKYSWRVISAKMLQALSAVLEQRASL